jgi:hypothetical protein
LRVASTDNESGAREAPLTEDANADGENTKPTAAARLKTINNRTGDRQRHEPRIKTSPNIRGHRPK